MQIPPRKHNLPSHPDMKKQRFEKPGYDIIGDVHGHAAMLKALLEKLGYRQGNGTWHHGHGRKAIFVGDLIDRGPEQLEAVCIVLGMVESNDALCIMGNHEYNAIQHSLCLRKLKDTDPHYTFLEQVPPGSPAYRECLDWFMTLPLWLDLGGFGVVHACWDTGGMHVLESLGVGSDRLLSENLHRLAAAGKPQNAPDRRAYCALENILKGTEMPLPDGVAFTDKDGRERHEIRTRWYRDDCPTCRKLAFMSPRDARHLPDDRIADAPAAMVPDKIIFIGHYWLDKDTAKKPLSAKVACVDYSAGVGGPLVAYRWNEGDAALRKRRFVHVDKN